MLPIEPPLSLANKWKWWENNSTEGRKLLSQPTVTSLTQRIMLVFFRPFLDIACDRWEKMGARKGEANFEIRPMEEFHYVLRATIWRDTTISFSFQRNRSRQIVWNKTELTVTFQIYPHSKEGLYKKCNKDLSLIRRILTNSHLSGFQSQQISNFFSWSTLLNLNCC